MTATAVPAVPSRLLSVRAVERVPGSRSGIIALRTGTASVSAAKTDDESIGSEAIAYLGATGKVGEVHPLADGRWLVGVGDGGPADLRGAGAALARALTSRAHPAASDPDAYGEAGAPVELAIEVAGWSAPECSALVTGLILGSHRFRVSRRAVPVQPKVRLLTTGTELAELTSTVATAEVLARATALARDLASMPSDVKTPTWLVETAARLAAEVPGVTSEIWSPERLAEEGFGGILAVGGGSARPPAMLQLNWAPAGARTDGRHLVLIGKGVTFDTGGISIKPALGMHLMRTDMSGGAAVIAAVIAVARLALPMRVTALVPAAENHVSGSAYRPGDIVRHYDGTTTEVGNTDAEGRMVLADAIGYAVRELAPDLIVDVATLTGAMKVALGMRTGGMFASDDELADQILRAGNRVGEQWWRMPLLDHVAEEVRSDTADVRQTPKGPGGISAALFLRHFTKGLTWAHLDMAGPARCEKAYAEVGEGATGFAARTLVELVRGYTAG